MRKSQSKPDAAPFDAEHSAPESHALLVRWTHWLFAFAFFLLVFSSFPILIAHPRFYWGEAGGVGAHPLFSVPLPLRTGRSGWGRSLHFLAAWVALFTGILYAAYGFFSGHFRRNLWPARADLTLANLRRVLAGHLAFRTSLHEELRYNLLQRAAYLAVVFILFPLALLSGLAMSPAITAVVPALVRGFGGHQSARTIHFLAAAALLGFFAVHVFMVWRAGFLPRTKAMIPGAGTATGPRVIRAQVPAQVPNASPDASPDVSPAEASLAHSYSSEIAPDFPTPGPPAERTADA